MRKILLEIEKYYAYIYIYLTRGNLTGRSASTTLNWAVWNLGSWQIWLSFYCSISLLCPLPKRQQKLRVKISFKKSVTCSAVHVKSKGTMQKGKHQNTFQVWKQDGKKTRSLHSLLMWLLQWKLSYNSLQLCCFFFSPCFYRWDVVWCFVLTLFLDFVHINLYA